MRKLKSISKEFKNITGIELLSRVHNLITDGIERKDDLFNRLAILYVNEKVKFKELKNKIYAWLSINSETIFSLAGYIFYIENDFKKAKKYFLKSIEIAPDNLDNWIDLAFALRHCGDIKTSNGIIFNFDYVVYYYKYLKVKRCDFKPIKYLISEIVKLAE